MTTYNFIAAADTSKAIAGDMDGVCVKFQYNVPGVYHKVQM